MAEAPQRDVLTFIVTLHMHQKRPDLENLFIVRHVSKIMDKFACKSGSVHFVRHWVPGDEYGDSIWLRIKPTAGSLDAVREDVWSYLKGIEHDAFIEKVWEPRLESDQEVFGSAPELGECSGYESVWCFLNAACRTALSLLSLSEQGRMDVPEWVVADIWVDFLYNALGVPDLTRCPSCGSDRAMRIPRCHACGFELDVTRSRGTNPATRNQDALREQR